MPLRERRYAAPGYTPKLSASSSSSGKSIQFGGYVRTRRITSSLLKISDVAERRSYSQSRTSWTSQGTPFASRTERDASRSMRGACRGSGSKVRASLGTRFRSASRGTVWGAGASRVPGGRRPGESQHDAALRTAWALPISPASQPCRTCRIAPSSVHCPCRELLESHDEAAERRPCVDRDRHGT
jgi:hypothetical protein